MEGTRPGEMFKELVNSESGGAAGSLLLFGQVALLLVVIVHGALVYRGHQVLSAAAQDAAHALAFENGTVGGAQAKAQEVASFASYVSVTSLSVVDTNDEAQVEVRGLITTPFYDFPIPITVRAEAPQEIIIEPSDRS